MDAECTGLCPSFTLKATVGGEQSEEIIFCMKTRNSGFSKPNIYTKLLECVFLQNQLCCAVAQVNPDISVLLQPHSAHTVSPVESN